MCLFAVSPRFPHSILPFLPLTPQPQKPAPGSEIHTINAKNCVQLPLGEQRLWREAELNFVLDKVKLKRLNLIRRAGEGHLQQPPMLGSLRQGSAAGKLQSFMDLHWPKHGNGHCGREQGKEKTGDFKSVILQIILGRAHHSQKLPVIGQHAIPGLFIIHPIRLFKAAVTHQSHFECSPF